MMSDRGLGINAKKCIYEGVIVPPDMKSAGRSEVNALEMKCLRS